MLDECEITVISQGFDQSTELFTHIPVPKLPIRTRWLNQLWFSWFTRRVVRQGFDVVHSYENITHGDVQTVSVKTVHASLKQRGMSALRIKSSPRLLAYLWLQKKRLCTPGHHNVFVSKFIHDETQDIMQNLSASSVIPPGVSIPDRAASPEEKSAARIALGLRPRTMTIGFVGHDFKKKGLDALLKAASTLPFDVQVAVFGNPSKSHQYSEQVALLGDGKSCCFMGVVSDMNQAYTAMDCLAHPTTQDAFPLVLLEAMALAPHELRRVVVARAESPLPEGCVSMEDWLAAQSALAHCAPTHPQDPGFWLFSSGSTGRPKATVHSQANPYWTAKLYGQDVLGLHAGEVCFSAA